MPIFDQKNIAYTEKFIVYMPYLIIFDSVLSDTLLQYFFYFLTFTCFEFVLQMVLKVALKRYVAVCRSNHHQRSS